MTRRLALLIALFLGPAVLAGPRLFSIKRSMNTNEVVYEARIARGGFDKSDPVRVYWIMNTKNGAIETLTGVERGEAYGVEVKSVDVKTVVFTIRALSGRTITAKLTADGKARASTQIQDKEAYIEKVFIEVQGHGILAKAQAVNLSGKAVADGSAVSERIPE